MKEQEYIDQYEKDIIESFENDEWKSIKNIEEEKQKHAAYARNTFLKNKRINIRITEKDFLGLKQKSLEEGIPYQSLISSILHKYLNGSLVENKMLNNL
jgi:predicted DNA binding CopG/RHH family protein